MLKNTFILAATILSVVVVLSGSYAETVYRYDLAKTAKLGSGFDNSTLDVAGTCVGDDGDAVYVADAEGQKLRLFVSKVETETELKREMEVTVEAEVKFFGLGLDASMGLAEKMSRGKSTTNFLVKLSVINGVKVMNMPRLLPNAQELLTQGKISRRRFREMCGTEYVVGVETGGYLFALLQMNEVTKEDEKRIKSSLKAEYGAAEMSAKVKESVISRLRQLSTTVHGVRIGGRGASATFGDVGELFEAIKLFPAQVQKQGGAPIRFITKGYETLALPGDGFLFQKQLARTTLETLYGKIVQLRKDLQGVERILEEDRDTPDWFQRRAQKIIQVLLRQIEKYRRIVQTCISTKFQECEQPMIGLSDQDRELLNLAGQFRMRRPDSVTNEMVCGDNLKKTEKKVVKGVLRRRLLPRSEWSFKWPKGKKGDKRWRETYDRYKSDKLYHAVHGNRVDHVQSLLRAGYDPLNLSSYECWDTRFHADSLSPNLVWSAIFFKRKRKIVDLLMDFNRYFLPTADLFKPGKRNGRTVLHIAVLRKMSDQVLQKILEISGAEDIDSLDRFGLSATHYAVKVGLRDADFSSLRSILHRARTIGHQALVDKHKNYISEAIQRWLPDCMQDGSSARVQEGATLELVEKGELSIAVQNCPWADDLPTGGLTRGRKNKTWRIEDSMPALIRTIPKKRKPDVIRGM